MNLATTKRTLLFRVKEFDEAHQKHKNMGVIYYENETMGIYFINDPDGYWLEILPVRALVSETWNIPTPSS